MMHVTDELELYALGVLTPADAARVAAHLAECPVCREQAHAIEEVVQELPRTLPASEVPARLRERILATAGGDVARRRAPSRGKAWGVLLRPSTVGLAGLTLAVGLLAASNARLETQLATVTQQRDDNVALADVADRIKEAGRWWYMAGTGQYVEAGGTLVAPRTDAKPFVLFNDMPGLAPGQFYTVWLVSSDNTWVRGAAFRPNGKSLQIVDVTAPIAGFERCAVTIEDSAWGRRTGPIIMESRIVPTPPTAQ